MTEHCIHAKCLGWWCWLINHFNLACVCGYYSEFTPVASDVILFQDILHCRKKTTGIQKIEFKVEVPVRYGGGFAEFWMFDVGGQRGERRKWLPVMIYSCFHYWFWQISFTMLEDYC